MTLVLLTLLCAPLILGKTTLSLPEQQQHNGGRGSNKIATTNLSIEETLLEVINHFTMAEQNLLETLMNQKLSTKKLLLAKPKECTEKFEERLEAGIRTAVGNFSKCNVLYIFTNMVVVIADTLRVGVEMTFETALIISKVMSCTTSLNPFYIISCIYTACSQLPEEFSELIDIAEDYSDAVEYFIPKIIYGIESCFNRTAVRYNTFIEDTLNNPNVCTK